VLQRSLDGRLIVSGGLGYLIGDRGSGFRYGQALVEYALSQHWDSTTHERVRLAFETEFGTTDRGAVLRLVYASASPAALLARFAEILGDCADAGEPWALSQPGSRGGSDRLQ
jgi:N-acetylglucosamine kinase-like BadF-type ATPase